jgi:hypothetical protein
MAWRAGKHAYSASWNPVRLELLDQHLEADLQGMRRLCLVAPGFLQRDLDLATLDFAAHLPDRIGHRAGKISLYTARQFIGIYRVHDNTYNPGTRAFSFDTDFLDPNLLPPGHADVPQRQHAPVPDSATESVAALNSHLPTSNSQKNEIARRSWEHDDETQTVDGVSFSSASAASARAPGPGSGFRKLRASIYWTKACSRRTCAIRAGSAKRCDDTSAALYSSGNSHGTV